MHHTVTTATTSISLQQQCLRTIRRHYSTRHQNACRKFSHINNLLYNTCHNNNSTFLSQHQSYVKRIRYFSSTPCSNNTHECQQIRLDDKNNDKGVTDFTHLPSPVAGSIKRVIVLQKVSLLEELRRGLLSDRLSNHIKNDARAHLADREHTLTVDIVKHTLQQYGIETKVVERLERDDIDNYDMILCVGGDGTFLRASRYIDEYSNIPVLGVNSSPSSSFGFFSSSDHITFPSLWKRVITGQAPVRPLWRMRVVVNDKPVGNLVLNEALFSSPLPSGTTRYVLRNGGVEQSQVSSGVWISTASGSTGAIHAAGGDIQALDDKRIQYRVRELYTLSAVKAAGTNGQNGILSNPHVTPPHSHRVIEKKPKHNISIKNNHNYNNDHSNDSNVTLSTAGPTTTVSALDGSDMSHFVRDNNHSIGSVHRPSTEDQQDQLNDNTVSKSGLIPVAPGSTQRHSISQTAATVLRSCGEAGFALMEGGFLANDFLMVSRMQSATIYLDGGGPNSAVEVGFGDRITFRTSAQPLHWVSPTLPPPYQNTYTDNWQLVTGHVRPAAITNNKQQTQQAQINQQIVQHVLQDKPIPPELSAYNQEKQ